MPTKTELLEEKTVDELKDMARDEDLSGYSGMRKDELIELIKSNYTKAEIQDWSETEEEVEEVEEEPEEIFEEEEMKEVEEEEPIAEEAEPTEMVDVERELGEMPEPETEEVETFKNVVTGVIIGLVILIVLVISYFQGWI